MSTIILLTIKVICLCLLLLIYLSLFFTGLKFCSGPGTVSACWAAVQLPESSPGIRGFSIFGVQGLRFSSLGFSVMCGGPWNRWDMLKQFFRICVSPVALVRGGGGGSGGGSCRHSRVLLTLPSCSRFFWLYSAAKKCERECEGDPRV